MTDKQKRPVTKLHRHGPHETLAFVSPDPGHDLVVHAFRSGDRLLVRNAGDDVLDFTVVPARADRGDGETTVVPPGDTVLFPETPASWLNEVGDLVIGEDSVLGGLEIALISVK